MSVTVECPAVCKLTEGPHWDDVNNVLYFIDIARKIGRWDPSTNSLETFSMGNADSPLVTNVVRTDKGRLLFTAGDRFAFFNPETKEFQESFEVEAETRIPDNRFNDGKCDPSGRFWAGTMGPEPPAVPNGTEQGSLYCLHRDRSITTHARKIMVSNGMGWCDSAMYFVDSLKRVVYVFDYEPLTGKTSNQRVAIDTSSEDGVPDGMCVDAEGMIWVAFFNGWKIIRYNPTTGTKLSEIKFPVQQVTSCCWGGPNLDILYATSGGIRLTKEQEKSQPKAGSIFTVRGLGVKGLKSDIFIE